MTFLPNRIAIGVLVVIAGVCSAVARLPEVFPVRAAHTPRVDAAGGICVEIAHPSIVSGLVCAPSWHKLAAGGIAHLGLPSDCAQVWPEDPLAKCSRLVFEDDGDGKCSSVRVEPMAGAARLVCGVGLDLNRATQEDLILLPGIGQKRARQIVESREAEGPYSEPGDLVRIKGIGEKTVERIRPWLVW